MRKMLLLILCITALIPATQAQAGPEDKNAPVFKFAGGDTHDFGTLKEDNPVVATYNFKFTNVGKKPLIITKVTASCGCTTADFSTVPVLPGKTGTIKVSLHTTAKAGEVDKVLYIYSNAKSVYDHYEIFIKGTITPKAAPIEK